MLVTDLQCGPKNRLFLGDCNFYLWWYRRGFICHCTVIYIIFCTIQLAGKSISKM